MKLIKFLKSLKWEEKIILFYLIIRLPLIIWMLGGLFYQFNEAIARTFATAFFMIFSEIHIYKLKKRVGD